MISYQLQSLSLYGFEMGQSPWQSHGQLEKDPHTCPDQRRSLFLGTALREKAK